MTTKRYAPEYRRQMVELARTGRTAEELSREFECSAQAIRNWVRQADLDAGRRSDGLTTAERAFDHWLERYQDKYPKATACLARDREELLAFYNFPAATSRRRTGPICAPPT